MTGLHRGGRRKALGLSLLLGFVLLLIGVMINVSLGSSSISFPTLLKALFFVDRTKEMLIVQEIRLPRVLIAILIGASLAVAGTIMQAMTRNPLANPQVFGVNAGASLIVVTSTVFLPELTQQQLVYSAFAGAALGGFIVYFISAGGDLKPARLAIAGMTVHFFLSSITQGLILFHENTTDSILYWLVGAIGNRNWHHVGVLLPWASIGLLGALALSKPLTMLSMGDDVARGLGARIEATRFAGGLLVIILAGGSVSVAGPIGFVGLLVPHIVRLMVGVDLRYVLPCSALYGSVLLVYADIVSRYISYPYEAPIGIVTAMLGTPFFLYLAYAGGKHNE
ncbi:iron ABC transporter permease [Paenibacillus sp. chi10]|uniref:Iron ABC transporter permease n=1 Tax=Paenibacillus suaedae TaxID=3077233 RepID=A0AAJ2JW50_9BACL|nr:iron ABC transporter permease [Paenibacillus sp. chi10]MDT8976789.1 iron ABC transporter permease [Paenibacillus sp. chi10]